MATDHSPEALVKALYSNQRSLIERISLCDELFSLEFPQKQAILDKWIVVFATHSKMTTPASMPEFWQLCHRLYAQVTPPRLLYQAFQQLFLHGSQIAAPFSATAMAVGLFAQLQDSHDYPTDYALQLFALAGACYEQQRAAQPAILSSLLPLFAAIIAHVALALGKASPSKKIVTTTAKQLVMLMAIREQVPASSDDVDAIVTQSLLHVEHLPLYTLSFQHVSIFRSATAASNDSNEGTSNGNSEDRKALPKAAFTKAVFEALESTHAIDPALTERFMPVFFDLFCQACQQSDAMYSPMRRQWLLDLFVELDTLLTGWHMLPSSTATSHPPSKRAKRQSVAAPAIERGLHVLQSILQVVDTRRVFDEGQDALDGGHATAYFSLLFGRLLPLVTMAVTAEVVATLINLNFGFAEAHLQALFAAVLAQPEPHHAVLLDALFAIYAQLRQVDMVLPAIVAAGADQPLAHMDLLEARLALAVPSLPAGQALELAHQLLSAEPVTDPALRLALCLAEHGLVSQTVVAGMDNAIAALATVDASKSMQAPVAACQSLLETLKTRLLTHTSMDTEADRGVPTKRTDDGALAASLDVLTHWHAHEGVALAAALKHVLAPASAGQASVQAFFQSDLFLDALPLHAPTVELMLRHCKSPLKSRLAKPLVKALFKCEASELAETEFGIDWTDQSTSWPFAADDALLNLLVTVPWHWLDASITHRLMLPVLALYSLAPDLALATQLSRTASELFAAIVTRGETALKRTWLGLTQHQVGLSHAMKAAVQQDRLEVFQHWVHMWLALFHFEFETVTPLVLDACQAFAGEAVVLELLLMVAQTLDEVDSKGSRTNQATAQVLGQLLEVGKEQLQEGEAYHFLGIAAKHGVDFPPALAAKTTNSAILQLQSEVNVPDGVLIYLANSVKRVDPSQLQLIIQHAAPKLPVNDAQVKLMQQLLKLAVQEVDETTMAALLQLVPLQLASNESAQRQGGLRLWTCLNRYASSSIQLKLARRASSKTTESLLSTAITADCFHDLATALTSTLTIGLSPIPNAQAEALLHMATLLAAFACLSREPSQLAVYHQACHGLLQTMLSRQRPAVDGASAVVISLLSKQMALCLRYLSLTEGQQTQESTLLVDETARLMQLFANSKANCAKHAPELIGACISQLAAGVSLSSNARAGLCQGVFAVMDMVEERDRNLIHACLPAYTRGVAKQLFNEYESKHKFTGRV